MKWVSKIKLKIRTFGLLIKLKISNTRKLCHCKATPKKFHHIKIKKTTNSMNFLKCALTTPKSTPIFFIEGQHTKILLKVDRIMETLAIFLQFAFLLSIKTEVIITIFQLTPITNDFFYECVKNCSRIVYCLTQSAFTQHFFNTQPFSDEIEHIIST